MVTEALIGAGLVLFEYVAEDASLARGVWMSAHLVNTFLLVAALTLCAVWASGVGAPSWAGRSTLASVLGLALLAVLVLGMSGAVTALGDTLFPAATLAEAKALTWSEGAHLFVRLRIWHPGLAVFAGVLLTAAVMLALSQRATQGVRKAARALLALYLLQLGVGLLDVWLLAPIAMQIIHLLLADLVWIALVTLTATSLEEEAVVDAPALARAAASSRA
jgi:heme A synthase